MSNAVDNQLWVNVPSHITSTVINAVMNKQPCISCELAKRNKLPKQVGSGISPPHIGHTISVDYQGKINPVSVRGYTGYFLFLDLVSNFLIAILTRGKEADKFLDALGIVTLFYQSYGHSTSVIRFDAGSTENSHLCIQGIQAMGMRADPAAVGSQFQNPVERAVQTLNKGVSAVLISQETLPPTYWCYAVEYWIKTANATPSTDRGITPQEDVTGKAPDLASSFRFPFGYPVTSTKAEGRHSKYDVASEFGIAIGDTGPASNKAIKIIVPGKDNRTLERLDVLPLRVTTPGAATSEGKKQRITQASLHQQLTFVSSAPLGEDRPRHPRTVLPTQTITQTDPPQLRRSARQAGHAPDDDLEHSCLLERHSISSKGDSNCSKPYDHTGEKVRHMGWMDESNR